MTIHISVRLAWHNDGWNGHICKNPKGNTYCVGRYSYPGDMISENRNLEWESRKDVAGKSCSELDEIPACAYSINAFGKDKMKAYADPPYKHKGLWVFDDERVGLVQEPFVAGADVLIDKALEAKGIQDGDKGFRLIFSAGQFPRFDFKFTWVREGDGDALRLPNQ